MQIVVDNGEHQRLQIGNKTVLGELTGATPAIAFHKGNFWIAWVGWKNQQLNIARLDRQGDGSFKENPSTKQTLESTSDRAPGLASDGSRLYMAFVGIGNHQVNIVSSLNGNDFQHASKVILNSESSDGPSLAVLGNQLFIGFCGVNGIDYSVIGPAQVDGSGKANFRPADRRTVSALEGARIVGMCAYDGYVVFVAPNQNNSLCLYRWQPGHSMPNTPYAVLPVKGVFPRCAAARNASGSAAPGNAGSLWISSFFTTGKQTGTADDPDNGEQPDIPTYDQFYWYSYRVVDNLHQSADIQGAASLFGDNPWGFAPIGVSDDGNTVAVAWRGTDDPSHVNVGTLPAHLTGS